MESLTISLEEILSKRLHTYQAVILQIIISLSAPTFPLTQIYGQTLKAYTSLYKVHSNTQLHTTTIPHQIRVSQRLQETTILGEY